MPLAVRLLLAQDRGGWAGLARHPALERALRAAPPPGTTVVVLDVAPSTRRRRIAARIGAGTIDPLDRYMLANPERAEHIEHCLVQLATHYLNAAVIENDDLDDATLERAFERALGRPAPPPSP